MFGFFTPLRACLKVRLEDYPLHGPASSGNAKLLNHLLENHKKYIDTDEYQYGMTPLHSALYNYHYVSMTVLLDHGAYHSPRVEGARNWTPLHTAIHEDDYTAIRLLLVYGASLKVKDKHGHTPEFYITNRIEFNNDHKPSLKSVNKPVLQSMISETCTIKKTFDTYNHKLGQALAENNLSGAAGCYQKIAEQWQLLGELEGHKDMRKFYFHKALDLYQKASKYADIIDLENVANLQQWLSIIESKSHKTNTHYFLPSHLPLQVQTNFANNTDSTESSRLLPSLSSG